VATNQRGLDDGAGTDENVVTDLERVVREDSILDQDRVTCQLISLLFLSFFLLEALSFSTLCVGGKERDGRMGKGK
jgi:hypothetical protein